MADNVPYTPGSGVTIAADDIASTHYQRIKVVLGADGTNLGDVNPANPMPVSGTVSVSGALPVSGTVSLSGPVSGTVSISGPVAISGTALVSVVPGVSVVAQVSGTVTAPDPNLLFTTGAPAASSTGQIVILKNGASVTIQAGASVSAQVSGTVSLSGTQLVSIVPGGSVSILNQVNTLATILSTVNVAIVAGAGGGGSVTTAGPSISATGQVVWLAGGQGTTANPVVVTGVVQVSAGTTSVSGTVSISNALTVQTILSTINVAIVAGAGGGGSVTTAGPSISATGQVVWIAGGQGTTATPIWVTGTVAAGAGTTVISGTVSVSGTAIVSVVPGVSVVAQASGTVTANLQGVVPVTTAASVSVTGLPVWLNPTQAVVVNTIAAGFSVQALVSGTVTVSGLAGHAVSVSAIAASQVLGTIIAVSGVTSISNLSTIVTILGTQIVSVASVQLQPVNIMLSSTVVGSQTTLLMTVYTGATFVTTAASFWVVPAGKVFRIMGMNLVNVSSAVLSRGQLAVIVGTAAASLSVTATVGIAAALPYAIQASTTPFNREGIVADIAAGTTVGVGLIGGTSQSIQGGVISGYLF